MKKYCIFISILCSYIFLFYIIFTFDFSYKSLFFIIPILISTVIVFVIFISEILKGKKMSVGDFKGGFGSLIGIILCIIYIVSVLLHLI